MDLREAATPLQETECDSLDFLLGAGMRLSDVLDAPEDDCLSYGELCDGPERVRLLLLQTT